MKISRTKEVRNKDENSISMSPRQRLDTGEICWYVPFKFHPHLPAMKEEEEEEEEEAHLVYFLVFVEPKVDKVFLKYPTR